MLKASEWSACSDGSAHSKAYGLCLGLAIPILALGLFALYVQNNGASATSGGFLQLLMTTTGRTAVEAVLAKDLGGYENVSNELEDIELRFGELVGAASVEGMKPEARADSGGDISLRDENGDDIEGNCAPVALRAGLGTVEEVQPLRRRIRVDHHDDL